MGVVSARCCQMQTLEKAKTDEIGAVSTLGPEAPKSNAAPSKGASTVRLKTHAQFKAGYVEKGKTHTSPKVFDVMARDGTDITFCMRRLSLPTMPQKSLPTITKHCQALAELQHPHICKFIDVFQEPRDLLCIYEKATPTTLFEHVRSQSALTEEVAAEYTRQVAMALSVAHGANIYHGRLTPSKLLCAFKDVFDEEDAPAQIKICDFGQAFILASDPLEAAKATPTQKSNDTIRYCVSPELASGELREGVPEGSYPSRFAAARNDMWAFGAIIYHMLTGSLPFQEAKGKELLTKCQEEAVSFSPRLWQNLSKDAQDCVEMLMKVNPGLRITAKALLNHVWVKVAKPTFPRKRMVQLLQNLRVNCNRCEFTRFVLRVVAETLPPDHKQHQTVEDAFRCLDGNSDGVLSLFEVVKGVRRYLDIAEDDLESLFKSIDRDGSGTLNVHEFLVATMDQRRSLSMPVLWQAFSAFDQDESGKVSIDEIERMVKDVEGVQLGKTRMDALCADIRSELAMVGAEKGMDFDHFVYVMTNVEPNLKEAVKKNMYRLCWNRCGVDFHEVRHLEKKWAAKPGGDNSPHFATRSAYKRRTNRVADSTGSRSGSLMREDTSASASDTQTPTMSRSEVSNSKKKKKRASVVEFTEEAT